MSNGGIIGKFNQCTIKEAKGIWNLNDVRNQRLIKSWPKKPTTLSHRANTTGTGTTTALTLTHPVSVQVGDLCVLFHASWDDDSDALIRKPSGFTHIVSRSRNPASTTTYFSYCVSYSILTSTSNVTLPLGNTMDNTAGDGTNAPDEQSYVAVYFNLPQSIESVTLNELSQTQGAGDLVARTINQQNFNNIPNIVFGLFQCITGTPAFNVSTSAFDATISETTRTNLKMIMGYKINNSIPSSAFTIDANDISDQQMLGFCLSVQ